MSFYEFIAYFFLFSLQNSSSIYGYTSIYQFTCYRRLWLLLVWMIMSKAAIIIHMQVCAKI